MTKISDILDAEISLYDSKIQELKEDSNGNLSSYNKDTLNYLNGRRDGLAFAKLIMQDLKKQ